MRFWWGILPSPSPTAKIKGTPHNLKGEDGRRFAEQNSGSERQRTKESLLPAGSVRCRPFTTDPFDSLTDTKRKKDHKLNLNGEDGESNLCTKRKRFGEEFLISPSPPPNTKGHPCGCPFVFGGGEGNRTPVRKPLDTTFSGCRTSIESFSSPRRCSGSSKKQPLSA